MAKSSKTATRTADQKKAGASQSVDVAAAVSASPASTRNGPVVSPPQRDPALEVTETAPEHRETENRRASQTPVDQIHPSLIYLGSMIKKTRKERGLTQMQVAKLCGFNSAAIFMVEAGRQNMTMKSLVAIASALDLPLGDLFPRTTPRTAAKLIEVAEVISDVKDRVFSQIRLLERVVRELRDEAGKFE
jgi:transcriptional regulator with XRE-family HTH domain